MQANEKAQPPVSAGTKPVGFIVACGSAFIISVMATSYFCRSMTWTMSAIGFLLMWQAMMVAMMMPSALPMFLNTRRAAASLSMMAFGYFVVWLGVGAGIYGVGVAVATRWTACSRAVPLSGALVIAGGAFQFTQ